ncbi:uncharacterized protein LOC113780142 [Coffea eugenioides]|uniref:uncharacterized protein LOC113780142 n=1 Tax=Coffea eugenioides TaxID=49369 RepID=UPI000F612626|nr:uncharacterized protein LOC113780142 [Coffea eugenioides]
MGYEILYFFDAFKEYHQIGMSQEDHEKTAFYTDQGVYCYTTMPFGLKNAETTYQRLVNQAFKSQIGRNVETYVDDILLKSQTTSTFMSDLKEVLEILRKTRMMLNPKKCVFGVTSEKFLGYLVSRRGIEANPDKVRAIQEMSPPRSFREVEGSGAGLLLENPQGDVCSYALRFDFAASNNEAEYETVIAELQLARKLDAGHILVYSDSQLVVCQILGEYEAREEVMHRYLSKVHQLIAHFESFEIQKIPRSQNKRADAFSRLVSTSFSDLNKTVLVEVLAEPGYLGEVVYPVYPENTWMGPLIRFLSQGELPDDRAESRKLQRKAARYALRQNLLYKRSYLGTCLRCITPEEGQRILQDIHEGLCGAHVGYRMLVKKTLLLGYFWPTMRVDAQIMVLSCPASQHHALEDPGNYAYVVVAVNYFTKWVEVEPLRTITGSAVQKFFWKSVVCRFCLPRVVISDNDRQFADNPFKAWCENFGIKQHFTSVGHPQANGQAENFNRTLLHGFKIRLHRAGSSWMEELSNVLWSYRTTPRSSTQETPFSLTYGSKTVVPAEFITSSPRIAVYAAELNEEERRVDIDLAEEKRDMAAAKVALYKNILTGYYNARVKHLRFSSRDLCSGRIRSAELKLRGNLAPSGREPTV